MNTSQHYITVIYHIFSDLPMIFRPFPYVLCLFLSVPSFSVVFLIIPSSVPFRVFRLLPFIPLFRLVSFQFSILGSDRSESGSPSDPFTFLFSYNSVFRWSPYVIVLWSYDPRFPFKLWSILLLFCSVYKSGTGKLCSYSLACNRTKPSVPWPSINPNTQSFSISALAS